MSRLTIAAGALTAAAVVGVPLGIAAASPDHGSTATRPSDTTSNLLQEKATRLDGQAEKRYADLEVEHIRFVKQNNVRKLKRALDIAKLQRALDIAKLQRALNIAKLQRAQNIGRLQRAVAAHQAEVARANAAAAARAEQAREASQASARAAAPAPRSYSAPTTSNGRCGGNLPPCYVMQRESGGNITAENPTSTASGKWQIVDGTWGGYGGYAHAADAPESVQDARAAQIWAGGAGCSAWVTC